MIFGALQYAKLTKQGIYILYVDFKISIDHAGLLIIMEDLGFTIIEDIYTNATTTFVGPTIGTTPPVHI